MNSQTAAFSRARTRTTLALLLEAEQKEEIGERIKGLRNNSAETNRSIADYCDVSVEAVRNWVAGKGILYDNAEKVAELFGVDVDWIWRGREKGETPDVMAALEGDRLDQIEAKLDEALERLAALALSQDADDAGQQQDQARGQSGKAAGARKRKRASG